MRPSLPLRLPPFAHLLAEATLSKETKTPANRNAMSHAIASTKKLFLESPFASSTGTRKASIAHTLSVYEERENANRDDSNTFASITRPPYRNANRNNPALRLLDCSA